MLGLPDLHGFVIDGRWLLTIGYGKQMRKQFPWVWWDDGILTPVSLEIV